MNLSQIVTASITAIIAVIGWIVAHYFSSRRDRRMKRREIITAHLTNAYKILAIDVTNRPSSPETNYKMEMVISELQLFGSEKQIVLAKNLAYQVSHSGVFDVDDLLQDLRKDLRKELHLKPVYKSITWLRLQNHNI